MTYHNRRRGNASAFVLIPWLKLSWMFPSLAQRSGLQPFTSACPYHIPLAPLSSHCHDHCPDGNACVRIIRRHKKDQPAWHVATNRADTPTPHDDDISHAMR